MKGAHLTSHLCVLVAVDTARQSGVAIYSCGALKASGSVDIMRDPSGPARWINDALRLASTQFLPVLLVPEKTYGGGTATVGGLGAAYGAWRAAWLVAGQQPKRIVPGVYPQVWRGSVLGSSRNPKGNPEYLHCLERDAASRLAGRQVTDQDEAAAICIGRWASYAMKTAERLPKQRKKVGK